MEEAQEDSSLCATALTDKRRLPQTLAAPLPHAHVATPPPFPPPENRTPTLEEGNDAMESDMPGDEGGLEVAREEVTLVLPNLPPPSPPTVNDDDPMASPTDDLIFAPYEVEEAQGFN